MALEIDVIDGWILRLDMMKGYDTNLTRQGLEMVFMRR